MVYDLFSLFANQTINGVKICGQERDRYSV